MDKTKQKKPGEQGYFAVMHFLGSTARTIHDGFQNIFPQQIEKQDKVNTKSCQEVRRPASEKTANRIAKKVETCLEEPASLLAPEDTVLPAQEEPSFKDTLKEASMSIKEDTKDSSKDIKTEIPTKSPEVNNPLFESTTKGKNLKSKEPVSKGLDKKEHKKNRRLDNPLFEMTSKPVAEAKKRQSHKAK